MYACTRVCSRSIVYNCKLSSVPQHALSSRPPLQMLLPGRVGAGAVGAHAGKLAAVSGRSFRKCEHQGNGMEGRDPRPAHVGAAMPLPTCGTELDTSPRAVCRHPEPVGRVDEQPWHHHQWLLLWEDVSETSEERAQTSLQLLTSHFRKTGHLAALGLTQGFVIA